MHRFNYALLFMKNIYAVSLIDPLVRRLVINEAISINFRCPLVPRAMQELFDVLLCCWWIVAFCWGMATYDARTTIKSVVACNFPEQRRDDPLTVLRLNKANKTP